MHYARSFEPVSGFRYQPYPWRILACSSSNLLSITPNNCITIPQAYNPHNPTARTAVQSNEVYPPPSPPRQSSTFVRRRINAIRYA
jgi:hypothetical protein